MMYVLKLARRDFSFHLPIRGLPGVAVAAILARPPVMLVTDLGLFAYGRHPYEMGCVQWWFGRLWPWLLLATCIALRITAPAAFGGTARSTAAGVTGLLSDNMSVILATCANTTAAILNSTLSPAVSNGTLDATAFASDEALMLTNPTVLSAIAVVLLVPWLLSLAAYFVLSKSEYLPTFRSNETAAEYTKRVKWDKQSDERLRAMLLVRVHPSLLRLIAFEARIWIGNNWKRWTKDKPEWFTDRWKRGLPDSVLPQQALKELGGKNRRRSTAAEQLGLVEDIMDENVSAPPAVVVVPATGDAPHE
jgi:hypothetical protein